METGKISFVWYFDQINDEANKMSQNDTECTHYDFKIVKKPAICINKTTILLNKKKL